MLADRAAAGAAARELPAFLARLRDLELLDGATPGPVIGGWLKLGMVGTRPARGRVLLTGDAAGLVNPLQGEGIAQAMASARVAAQAVLAGPALAPARYTAHLASTYAPPLSFTALTAFRQLRGMATLIESA